MCLISSTELKSQTTSDTDEGSAEPATTPKTTKYKVKKNIFRYNNVFSFYPFQSAINYMTVGYELKTGEKTAFKTIAGYAQQQSSLLGFSDISNYSGFKIEMELKYFINKKSVVFNGIYFAPFAMYKSCNFTMTPILEFTITKLLKPNQNQQQHISGFCLGIIQKLARVLPWICLQEKD